ncbi:MAG: cobalamin-dependent protein, partial [Sulfurovaceae bacterium]|nr:cobalamin-dependent protein [Sulfurovaceae bacterium]
MNKKKILLIMPDAHMHTIKFGPISKSLREAPLTLTTLASMVDESKFDIRIVDESIDDIPADYEPDIVGISILTGTACRGYKVAEYFRNQNIPVVLGGPHVTVLPDEASQHADSIVIGMAENTWGLLLDDFWAGNLQERYDGDDKNKSTILSVPQPRIELQRRSGYTIPNTVQATRGCKHRCDFCSVTALYPKVYQRPIGDIIRDIKAQKGSRLVFNDVSLVDDVEYAKELFTALKPLKKTWGGLATIEVAQNDELLDLMR